MTNKLLEILSEFDELHPHVCNNGDKECTKSMHHEARQFLADKLVEYARSVVPPEAYISTNHIRNRHENAGFDYCRTQIFSRIDQDLQSLNK